MTRPITRRDVDGARLQKSWETLLRAPAQQKRPAVSAERAENGTHMAGARSPNGMRALWERLDRSFLFDPSRFPQRDRWVALLGVLGCLVFILRRVSFLPRFPGRVPWVQGPMHAVLDAVALLPAALRPGSFDVAAHYGALGFSDAQVAVLWWARLGIWVLETGVWAAYLVGFVFRRPAAVAARGFMETAFPALVAVFPMFISAMPYTFDRWLGPHPGMHVGLLLTVNALMLAGGALHVGALFTLRDAFSITTEARTVVDRGPYAFIRHPVYAAHFVVFGCQALLRAGVGSALLYAAFVATQVHRAGREERKLAGAFPAYAAYMERTGRFIPRWGPQRRRPAEDAPRTDRTP